MTERDDANAAPPATLTDAELRALAYFAVGIGSEGGDSGRDVSHRLSFADNIRNGVMDPVGNSGYSIGTLHTDPGRRTNSAVRMIVGLLPALCAGLVACASSQPTQAVKADFNGGWSVEWCDKSNPKLDCGGFNITLVQEGDRICGDFGGALVNLRQIDEGTIVGTAVGSTAVLAVESMRNQAIALVRAERRGDALHWRTIDEIKRGGNDIDIIAGNAVLKRDTETSPNPEGHPKEKQTCNSFLGRPRG